jgi:nucleolar protein 56
LVTLFITEAGLILLDDRLVPLTTARFAKEREHVEFKESHEGRANAVSALIGECQKLGVKSISLPNSSLQEVFAAKGFETSIMDAATASQLSEKKLQILLASNTFKSEIEVREFLRNFAMESSKERIRELSAQPDLQVMEGVQGLDEIDKALNVVVARLREWYGLHFPELAGLVDDPIGYAKIALAGTRDKMDEKALEGLNLSPKKVEDMMIASKTSKGGSMSKEDAAMVALLAETVMSLSASKDRLQRYVESSMRRLLPNISAVAGETIGARLLAKAGGLARLAKLPSSTIQVLGAEKALFRALKTGSRPPKHGILFQHEQVHGSPKWQRGKIARSLASKIAIAARVDMFRGEKQEGIESKFAKRLEEIREKYKEPPPEEPKRTFKPKFVPRTRDRRERRRR